MKKIFKQSFADRLYELKNDALDYIEGRLLISKNMNFTVNIDTLRRIGGMVL